MTQDIRWHQRFSNFARALALLREPLAAGIETLSPLEKEGTIQRFEVVVELAWKTLKDYLEHAGAAIHPVTPRTIIKEAFAAHILKDGQVWIDMLDHRNVLSHSYDSVVFDEAVLAIRDRYHAAIEALHAWFLQEIGSA
jgi:nucleotidyltransferase substrate binding protein (TIGR01987 family)